MTSKMKIGMINIQDLPEPLKMKLMKLHIEKGKLSKDDMSQELLDEIEEYVQGADIEMSETDMEDNVQVLNVLSLLTIEGLDRYLNLSEGLLVPFHVPDTNETLIKLHNKCAEFIRRFNEVDLEHHDCIPKEEKVTLNA